MGIASAKRWLRERRSTVLSCALIPIAILSGHPEFGCICADGHYEFFCRGGRPVRCSHEATAPLAAIDSGCSCCPKSAVDDAARNCCHRDVSGDASGRNHGPQVGSKRCCTPVLRNTTERVLTAQAS